MSAAKHTPGPWVVADDVVFQIRAGDMHVAHLVWSAFGADVANYVEPFAGSIAVLP